MTDKILAIEPIKKEKSAFDVLAMVDAYPAAPITLGNALAETVRAKCFEIVLSHFQDMGEIISKNIQYNIKEKKEWNRDDLIRLLKRLFSSHQTNFLDLSYRIVAQI